MIRFFFSPFPWVLLFLMSGCLLVPWAGFQNDEALFASGIYDRVGIAGTVRVFHRDLSLMLMSYLGALKSWLYAPYLQVFPVSVWSVRLPVVIFGAATLWLLHRLLWRVSGPLAAAFCGALLATDPSFVVTTAFDWGPVALQHLLGIAGLTALVVFAQQQRDRYLAAGFAALGLGLWDKALFAWFLSGAGLATLLLFPRRVWALLTPRRAAIACASFFIGSFPLWLYNYQQPWATFRGNAGFSFEHLSGKVLVLRATLDGSSLFGYIPRETPEPGQRRPPEGALERASVWLDEVTGSQRTTWTAAAFAVALLLMPWLLFTPSRGLALWAVLACLIAWVQMAATNGAGASAHHCVLLWPLPQILLVAALVEIARLGRAGITGALLLAASLFTMNTLVTNRHLALLIQNGPTAIWSDALLRLPEQLARLPAAEIYVNDWGFLDSLRLTSRGRLPLRLGSDPLSKPELSPEDRREVAARLRPDVWFVSFTDGNEAFAGVNQRMREVAGEAGFRRRTETVIHDRHGRPLIEVFRYLRPD